MNDDDVPTDQLLAAYADDPHALAAAERARVEAWLATTGDAELGALRQTVAEVRALPTPGTTPDWKALEAGIFAQTTRAPQRGRWFAIGGAALAVAAALVLLVRPGPHAAWPTLTVPTIAATQPPAPAPVAADDDDGDDDDDADLAALLAADDEASDLDGLGPIDDAVVDEVIALDDEDADSDDDLPAIGATWTGWLDDFSDVELDRALAWLDAQEAG